MDDMIYISGCNSYDSNLIKASLKEILIDSKLLSFVKKGMKIGIKANLVSAMKPDTAATTHPLVIKELCKILLDMGATVVIGDSPGGLFNKQNLDHIYKVTEMTSLVEENVSLNYNFTESVKNCDGLVVKVLDCSNWLFECDALINICKLKTHGMMNLSCAVKNLFGTVPGLKKPEYHYRYPDHTDFANMLIDINEFYKFNLNIVDAITGMEGNGPTSGTPKHIGCLIAGTNPYNIDLVASKLINLDPNLVPTIVESKKRNLITDFKTNINIDKFIVKDYELITEVGEIEFKNKFGIFSKIINPIVKKMLKVKPKVTKSECIGCKKCYNICPAKAITMVNGKPKINRKICIRCFCCQEFCPVGAMKTKRNPLINKIMKM